MSRNKSIYRLYKHIDYRINNFINNYKDHLKLVKPIFIHLSLSIQRTKSKNINKNIVNLYSSFA